MGQFLFIDCSREKRAVTNKEITFKLLLIKTMISNVLPSSATELIKVTAYKM